ncbi:hypothetical protein NDQ53_01590 [Rossellomorea marisflavi]|uniref:hypothetical protein n=1 Tax=Rossellomorea marisflavi TaxID=189381 RepID=UPI00203E42ED|nr:hypothetical protein [Rossellomorea marisflavi]MCM2587993.1 hypothetical protein [Rossellomorea marisflavi]
MFVKMYQYHIQEDKIEEYFQIQEKASMVYSQYIEYHTMYFNSKTDSTRWVEITRYKDKNEYERSLKLINQQEEIQQLFKEFQSLLVTDKKEIIEEDFAEKQEKCTFKKGEWK